MTRLSWLLLLGACADPTGQTPSLAKGGHGKVHAVRIDAYPASAFQPHTGETRQACGIIVHSDSTKVLSANQVGITLCDSIARLVIK